MSIPVSLQRDRTSQQLAAARESFVKIRQGDRKWKDVNSEEKTFDSYKVATVIYKQHVTLLPHYNMVVYSTNSVITRLRLGSHCLYFPCIIPSL